MTARSRRLGRPRTAPIAIWKAKAFIRDHFANDLSLRRVAKAVNLNAAYLSEKFRGVAGERFVDYIARTRFEQARRLLRNSNLSVKTAAFESGFQSLSQFNRVFEKLSGKSPTMYRAELVKERRQR